MPFDGYVLDTFSICNITLAFLNCLILVYSYILKGNFQISIKRKKSPCELQGDFRKNISIRSFQSEQLQTRPLLYHSIK